MTRHPSLAIAIAALATLGAPAGAADKKPEPLTIKLSARMSSVGSEVIVRARVEPDARSRDQTIEWVADDQSGGSHFISMDGRRAPITHHYPLKGIGPGEYQVTAILRLNDGSEIRRTSTLSVFGLPGPDAFGGGATQGAAGGRVRPAPVP
jgi:hypothetical protein